MNYRRPPAKQPNTGKKKMGRPSIYSPELAATICGCIAEGMSLRKVCELPGMPAPSTVFLWLAEKDAHPDFSEHYARACEDRGHWLAEGALEIADAANPKGKAGNANIQKARLQVDTRKWFASKLAPKSFGDRVQAELTGSGGGPVAFALTPMDWDGLLKRVTGSGQEGKDAATPVDPAASGGS